jgi:F-type H+-transporting ATPase subunit a
MEKISLSAETIFHIGPVGITNSIIATWLAIIVIVSIFVFATRKMRTKPTGIQNFGEFIIEALLNMCTGVTGDRKKAEKFLPFIATFFLFIMIANWMELIPGFAAFGLKEVIHGKTEIVPILRSANTDLNTTLAFAIISVFATQFFGIAIIGFVKHIKKYINFKSFIDFFVGILEIISETSRIISFSFRLFGNIFAGEVLLVVISFLVPYIIPIPFYGLELFVGFIQALVFSMLTLVFMTVGTMEHEEH